MRNDILLAAAAVPLYVAAVAKYGYKVLVLLGLSVILGFAVERVGQILQNRNGDILGFVNWVLFPLVFSPGFPLYMSCASIVFGLIIATVFFGGHGRSLAAPLAVGWAFGALSFSTAYGFGWLKPFPGTLGFQHFSAGIPIIDHPVEFLSYMPDTGLGNILLGAFPQPSGNAIPLVLLVCGMVVFLLRASDFATAASFFLTIALLDTFFWIILPGQFPSPGSLLVGDLLFAGIFVLSDSRTAARTRGGRYATGCLAGVLGFLIRFFAASPDGTYFAVLAANSFCPLIDEVFISHSVKRTKA
ncbi:MAG: RnfABCDGE type electron transport complex subunit D [Clostridia bacterium]